MKKIISIVLLVFLSFSCAKKVPLSAINDLNGYWQIMKVEKEDGGKKEYPVTVDYDYFELKNNLGFHKKVRWQPLGKYVVDAMQEKVEAKEVEGNLTLNFSSEFGKRTEMITELTKESLVIQTDDHSKFYYKKVEDKPRSNGKTVE